MENLAEKLNDLADKEEELAEKSEKNDKNKNDDDKKGKNDDLKKEQEQIQGDFKKAQENSKELEEMSNGVGTAARHTVKEEQNKALLNFKSKWNRASSSLISRRTEESRSSRKKTPQNR